MTKQVLQQALDEAFIATCNEALAPMSHAGIFRHFFDKGVEAALAQRVEQQPVAWKEWGTGKIHEVTPDKVFPFAVWSQCATPFYAGAAPAAQPLTDEQIEEMHEEQDFIATLFQVKRIVRATELAHGIGEKK